MLLGGLGRHVVATTRELGGVVGNLGRSIVLDSDGWGERVGDGRSHEEGSNSSLFSL